MKKVTNQLYDKFVLLAYRCTSALYLEGRVCEREGGRERESEKEIEERERSSKRERKRERERERERER
jgi:hypothetical protein